MDWSFIFDRAVDIANIATALVAIFAIYYAIESANIARQSVKDSSENFKRQNTPYLQIGDFKVIDNRLIFSVFNLNQYPAKIEGGKLGVSFKPDLGELDRVAKVIRVTDMDKTPEEWQEIYNALGKEFKNVFDKTIVNNYVVKDSPVEMTYGTYAQSFFDMEGRGYFLGRIFYTDEVAGTKRVYRFAIRIYGTPAEVKSEFAINANGPI